MRRKETNQDRDTSRPAGGWHRGDAQVVRDKRDELEQVVEVDLHRVHASGSLRLSFR